MRVLSVRIVALIFAVVAAQPEILVCQTIPAGVGSRQANAKKQSNAAKTNNSVLPAKNTTQRLQLMTLASAGPVNENSICQTITQPAALKQYGQAKQNAIELACLKNAGKDLTVDPQKSEIDAALGVTVSGKTDETAVCQGIDQPASLQQYGTARQKAIRDACLKDAGKDFSTPGVQADIDAAINNPLGPSCGDVDGSHNDTLTRYGVPKAVALRAVCGVANLYTASDLNAALSLVDMINDGDGYSDAIVDLTNAKADITKPLLALVVSSVNAPVQIANNTCVAVFDGAKKQFNYNYKHFLPATRTNCGDDGVYQFFNLSSMTTYGNTVQYLFNPNLGTNQYSSDLLTATFPQGFQVILAGTATTGTTQSTPQASQTGTASSTTTATPDPVATVAQKIEAGGDFNLRFSLPLLRTPPGNTTWLTYLQPSIGFNLASTTSTTNAKTSAQSGISSTNQYLIYLPLESYFETSSITGTTSNGLTSATLYADLRAGGEILSNDYATSIGLKNRSFALVQAAAGIDFAGSIRVGMQYFWGPSQSYTLTNSAGQTGSVTSGMKGFHVVLSYSTGK